MINQDEWERFFSQFQDKVLFSEDFNSHNIWSPANICRTGDSLCASRIAELRVLRLHARDTD